MKFLLLIGIFITLLFACQTSEVSNKELNKKAKDTTNFTSIKWIDSSKDIGIVPAGKTTEIKFRFLNTGSKPLYVIEAKPGCGCTLADYPKAPVLPNKEGVITADYNVHKDGEGDFRKSIKVTTNTVNKTENYIFFYGTIKPDTLTAKPAK